MSDAGPLLTAGLLDDADGTPLAAYLGGAVDPFLAAARAEAIRTPAPQTALERYLDAAANAPPRELAVGFRGHTLPLTADDAALGDLTRVVYAIHGWDALLELEQSVAQVIRGQEYAVAQELESATAARRAAETWTEGGVHGTPQAALDAERARPGLRLRESAAAEQAAADTTAFMREIQRALVAQREALVGDFEVLLERFEAEARMDLHRVLDENASVAALELKRYDIRVESAPLRRVTFGESEHKAGVVAALRTLARHRATLRELAGEVTAGRGSAALVTGAAFLALWDEALRGMSPDVRRIMGDPLYHAVTSRQAQLESQLREAEADYVRLRAGFAVDYPIISRIAEIVDEDDDEDVIAGAVLAHSRLVLANVARIRKTSGSDQRPATRALFMLHGETDPALRVADHALTSGMQLWEMPRLVELTSRRMGFVPGDLGYVMVQRVRAHILARRGERDALLDEVGMALGALSLFTGLPGVVVLGVFSALRALRTIDEYKEARVFTGSALDAARAVTDEEPSAFRLYVDLISAGLDMFAGGAALRALAKPVSRVVAVRQLEQAVATQGPAGIVLRSEARDAERALATVSAKLGAGDDKGGPLIARVVDSSIGKASPSGGARTPGTGTQGSHGKPAKNAAGAGAKTPQARVVDAATLASNPVLLRAVSREIAASIKKSVPDAAGGLELLTDADWDIIVLRAAGFDAATTGGYGGLLSAVQGEVLERIVPHMAPFKAFLELAEHRKVIAPGAWGPVRVARLVEASGSKGRRKFSDFVVWAEGVGADNKGYTLLLGFVEAKAGDPSSLFRTVVRESSGRRVLVGQLGRIEQRLRAVIWLDQAPTSFENLVYALPRADDMDVSQQLTKLVAVMTRPPRWSEVGHLVGTQNLNADVWPSPVSQKNLRAVAHEILVALGKAPK